jgi:hypothetical protein
LRDGPRRFRPASTCPVLLRCQAGALPRRIRDCHPLWSLFPEPFCAQKRCSLPLIEESLVLQPRPDESERFGLRPVRSPLLGPSRLLSFPRGTEMFQFPPFAAWTYGFSPRAFRDPGLNARLTAPPGLSQSSTPFVAYRRQDIPHTPLRAWPRRPRPHRRQRPSRHVATPPDSTEPGLSNLPLTQGSCREIASTESGDGGYRRSLSLVTMQLLPLPKLSKNNDLVLRDANPTKGFTPLLHGPGVGAPSQMPPPATREPPVRPAIINDFE